MCAIVPAGNGGRGRCMPAALCPRARFEGVCPGVVAAATGAVLLTSLATGFGLPQAEWLAVPERLGEMKHRPRDAWPHFVALALTLCGLDTVNDVAGAVGVAPARRRRRLIAVAVRCFMVVALLLLATAPALSQDRPGALDASVLPLAGSQYAGQWAEIVVGAMATYVLWFGASLATVIPVVLRRLLLRPSSIRVSATAPATVTMPPAMRCSTRYDA